jgi:OpgC protein
MKSSHPVTPEGRRALWVFIAGIVASAIMGAVLAQTMETWLWMTITAVGMAVSAIWFITTARARNDFSTHDE